MANKTFTIIKKVAKHGNQCIIVIPKMLEPHLKPGVVVELKIDILEDLTKGVMDYVERQ